jgi:hypothetical protein
MRDAMGGFCYFNNAAVGAELLRKSGRRVAVLDVDVHHGNGTQEIFWNSPDVLTVSIHMNPSYEYPYYWGFADETGGEAAPDSNLNLPLPVGTDDTAYRKALVLALDGSGTSAPRPLSCRWRRHLCGRPDRPVRPEFRRVSAHRRSDLCAGRADPGHAGRWLRPGDDRITRGSVSHRVLRVTHCRPPPGGHS